ncbi:MAG: helix-turn-helix domain-containing protein [Bryobacteraceae bacterium]
MRESQPVNVITVPEAARALRLSVRSVVKLISAGRLRSFRVGRARRLSQKALVDFIRARERETTQNHRHRLEPTPAP